MRASLIISVIFCVIVAIVFYDFQLKIKNRLDLITYTKNNCYPIEIHTIETKDGYILTLFRIPHDHKNVSKNQTRTPVLIMHGLLSSASDFLALGNDSLPYLLIRQGYDVWLGNARGTTWSKKHKVLNPDVDREKYWNFSWHEIGVIDLPTKIDYILDTTKHKQLQYIGISQGSAIAFVLLSEMPEYNKKLKLISALSPGVFMGDTVLQLVLLAGKYVQIFDYALSYFNIYEISGHHSLISKYFKYVCIKDSFLWVLCLESLQSFTGIIYEQDNEVAIDRFIISFPGGASRKQFVHYFQVVHTNDFLKYDYGEHKNLAVYGQKKPPTYDFSKVKVPVAIYYTMDDLLITHTACERLIKLLPNVTKSVLIEEKHFSHSCSMCCRSTRDLLLIPVIEEMKKYDL